MAGRALLGPLHPVLDWASDRSLATLGRGTIFAVRGAVEDPVVALTGHADEWAGAGRRCVAHDGDIRRVPALDGLRCHPFGSAQELYDSLGVTAAVNNRGRSTSLPWRRSFVPRSRRREVHSRGSSTRRAVTRTSGAAVGDRVGTWADDADALVQRRDLHERRMTVEAERRLAEAMTPSRELVRPLLMVVPADWPVARTSEGAL